MRRRQRSASTPVKAGAVTAVGRPGAIYDLASVLEGGPTGPWLRGDAFRAARARVLATFGEL